MLAAQAAANGAGLSTGTRPASATTPASRPVIRWVEPLVPVNAAAPVHPNLGGMLGVSELPNGRSQVGRGQRTWKMDVKPVSKPRRAPRR